MNKKNRDRLALALGAVIMGTLLFNAFLKEVPDKPNAWAHEAVRTAPEVPISALLDDLEAAPKKARAVILEGKVVLLRELGDGTDIVKAALPYSTYGDVIATARQSGVEIAVETPPAKFPIADFAIVLLLGASIYLTLRVAGGGNKSAIKVIDPKSINTDLSKVAGLDKVRDEIREIIDLITKRDRIVKNGGRMPKGLLLEGPPGTGKTLLARAMAKEAGVKFLSLDMSALNEKYVGVGPSRVRKAFEIARENAPCIMFMDEIDAVGARGASDGRVDMERNNVINTLLTEMQGISGDTGVFIIAATNRADMVDPAILRPGRIDRKTTIGRPDVKARREILAVHLSKMSLAEDADIEAIARSTPGMTGADLEMIASEANLAASRDGCDEIHDRHLKAARARLMLGSVGNAVTLSDTEREICAWHEAGHALAALAQEETDPIEHATILPHGGSLGHVLQVPSEDRNMHSRKHLQARLTVLAAGRAAEQIKFGKDAITSGASSDIQAMTALATDMVARLGMSPMGMMAFERNRLGELPANVQSEVWKLLNGAEAAASELLERHGTALERIAGDLLSRETLTAAELQEIWQQESGVSKAAKRELEAACA